MTGSSVWRSTATTASTDRPSPSCRTSTRLSRRLPRMAESRGNPYYIYVFAICFVLIFLAHMSPDFAYDMSSYFASFQLCCQVVLCLLPLYCWVRLFDVYLYVYSIVAARRTILIVLLVLQSSIIRTSTPYVHYYEHQCITQLRGVPINGINCGACRTRYQQLFAQFLGDTDPTCDGCFLFGPLPLVK